jgi:hypothetical protein
MAADRLATLVAGLGLGSFVFGVAPALAPRFFGRLFGLPEWAGPTVPTMVRSVGVRDAVLGAGLWAAATRRGDYRPWLLARALADSSDTLAVALAVRAGAREPRFMALGALALGAAVYGIALSWATSRSRRAATPGPAGRSATVAQ